MSVSYRAVEFRRRVAIWGQKKRRTVPWRKRRDPYRLLMAELMLRRTRSAQVAPVFTKFVLRFPTPLALASSSERALVSLLKPLGLKWRTPAFRGVARKIVDEHHGRVPRDVTSLQALPGVGDYVASAVSAFAFNQPAVLIDTNTVRLAARLFGTSYGPESRRDPQTRSLVAHLFDPTIPRRSAESVLDFASLICVSGRPLCEECPMTDICEYWGSLTTRGARVTLREVRRP